MSACACEIFPAGWQAVTNVGFVTPTLQPLLFLLKTISHYFNAFLSFSLISSIIRLIVHWIKDIVAHHGAFSVEWNLEIEAHFQILHLIYHTKGSTEFYQDHFSLLPTSIVLKRTETKSHCFLNIYSIDSSSSLVATDWNERKSGRRKSTALNHRSLIPFAKPPPPGFLASPTSDIEPIFDYLMGHNGFPIWD